MSEHVVSEHVVRACEERDLDAVSVLAAKLVRFHHEMDPERYLIRDKLEEGYRWWLAKELAREGEAVIDVLEIGGRIAGYAYGRVEGRDWMRLLEAHGELHDVWVEEDARGIGAAEALVRHSLARLEELGAPRVVLSTGFVNARARRFFERLGFRPTMLEMTRSSAAG